MKNKETIFYKTIASDYNEYAAGLLLLKFQELQKRKDKIYIALSGGTTPMPILEIVRKADLNWNQFSFFMVDERCVPLSHEHSNYNNINESFLKHIASRNYSMIREGLDIDESIRFYNKALLSELNVNKDGIPVFDLILLGMGEDGHTASLFPNTEALMEQKEFTVRNYVPQLESDRITLSYPILKNAEEAIVLAKGSKKGEILDELYASEATQYPMYELVRSGLKMNWIISE